MFLFSCCRDVDTNKGYMIKKKDNNNRETVKFVPSLQDVKNDAINDNHIIIQKVQKSIYNELIKQYKGTSKKWTDPEFPPESSSLGNIESLNTSQWKRISDILNKPALFEGKIQPKDVIQGNLGDCYFLSALAALAEEQSRIKNVFEDQEYNPNGIYKVTMRIDGIIQQILVDDYIPVNANGEPLFCQPNKNQFWVLIMEKAWAKAHGSYANIVAGSPTEVFKAVTYAPAQLLIVKQSEEEKQKLWRTIVNRASQNKPCCCGTDDKQDQDWDRLNLVQGHAYTLIHAATLQCNNGKQHKMLLLRNPWGRTQWQGQGSESDIEFWNSIIPSRDKDIFLKYSHRENDGIFFMTYFDFCKYFSQVHFCLLENHGNYLSEDLFLDKKNHASLFRLEVKKANEYIFELHQSGIRGENLKKIQDGLSRSTLLLAQIESSTYRFVDAIMKYNQQDLTLSAYLYPGQYMLYAKLDPTRHLGQNPQRSSVSVYSTEFTDLELTDQKKHPNFLQMTFLNYAKHHKRQSYNNDLMWISWKLMFQQGGFAFIGFGNSQKSNRKFIIQFDEDEFNSLNFKLKKPYKGKGREQVLQVYPGQQKVILARVKNISIKSLKFPPQLGIKMEKISSE